MVAGQLALSTSALSSSSSSTHPKLGSKFLNFFWKKDHHEAEKVLLAESRDDNAKPPPRSIPKPVPAKRSASAPQRSRSTSQIPPKEPLPPLPEGRAQLATSTGSTLHLSGSAPEIKATPRITHKHKPEKPDKSEKKSPKIGTELDDLLAVRAFRPLFLIFLEQHYCSENLLCYEAIVAWKKIERYMEPRLIKAKAVELHYKYVKLNSDCQVNLPLPLRNKVEEGLKEHRIARNIFDSVQQELNKLLYFDSFMKFKESPLFTQYIVKTTLDLNCL